MSIRKWCILLIILIIGMIFTIFYYNNNINLVSNNFVDEVIEIDKNNYSLFTLGCRIKHLDPWDKSITKFFKKIPAVKCPKEPKNVLIYQTVDGHLKFYEKAKEKIAKKHKMNLTCTKRAAYRNKWEKDERKTFRLSDNVTEFTEETLMDVEYAQIKCFAGNASVYENYFFYPLRKPEVENECRDNFQHHLTAHPVCRGVPQLSVLVLGIDSLSKSNLIRNLPKTIDYVVQNLSAIEMMGYNKVGLNTFPSLMPYLTGKSQQELHKSCWGENSKNKLDNCTFLMDIFAKAGYRTAFVENQDDFGLFLFNRGGFHRQLAHYYSHTVYVPVYKSKLLKNNCWRGKPHDERVLEWALMYQREFAGDLHYGHFWISDLSHNSVNEPQLLDPIVSGALQKMGNESLLNNTLLVFMSDHGIRFGKFRETKIGRLEENLPFMYLIFPEWFREKYPAAIERIRENTGRLVTTFDLHETLKSIINCDYTSVTSLNEETPREERGISLFKPISDLRNCKSAGIPSIYCACDVTSKEVDVSSDVAKQLATLVVTQLNAFTFHLRSVCSEFHLESVLGVTQLEDLEMRNSTTVSFRKSYTASVLVNPAEAKFEANIYFDTQNSSYVVDRDIRRINAYGNSSHCVSDDALLKSICFCI